MRLLDDLPIESDLWGGLGELAGRLAEGLPRFPASSPVLVSGPWGSGKTSLLKAIHRKLEETKDREAIDNSIALTVSLFEAWRYEGEMPIFAALVRQILQEIQETPVVQARQEQERLARAREKLWKRTVAFCGGVGPGLAGMLGGPAGAVTGLALRGLFAAEKVGPVSPGSSDQALRSLLVDRSEALWAAFRDLLTFAYPVRSGDDPVLLVLIDDLDRCSPEGTIQLLEGIRHFVARSEELPIRFIAALDRGILARAIARKFEGLDAYEGNRYLEKIFPLVFNLPRPNLDEIDRLVGGYADHLELGKVDREVARSVFANEMFANPRLIKRVLNRFALWLEYERSLDGSWRSVDPNRREQESRQRVILVAWLAACERWPGLRGLLARRKSHYWQELWAYARGDGGRSASETGRRASTPEGQGSSLPPDPDAEKILEEQDLRSWLKSRDEDGASFERAERSLQRWGL